MVTLIVSGHVQGNTVTSHPVCECGKTVPARLSEDGIWYIPPDFKLDGHVMKRVSPI